jgi:hypothetical protein
MLANDYGPFDIIMRFRHLIGVRYDHESKPFWTNELSRGALCMYCNSIWFGVIITLFYFWLGNTTVWLMLPFAFSGLTVMVLEGK